MSTLATFLSVMGAAIAAFSYAAFRMYIKPYPPEPEEPPSAPVQPAQEPGVPPAPPVDRVRLCALAQQAFEGWYLPGSTHDGVHYPDGSGSYRRNNPGNLTKQNPDGSSSFLTFSSYEVGFAALENYIRRVIAGRHPAYKKGPATTFYEYTHIYTGDKEPAPTNYCAAICKMVGALPSTPISFLLQ